MGVNSSSERLLGKDGHGAFEGQEARLAIPQLDGLRAAADVRRIDLELQEEEVVPAPRDVPELEREPPVVARLAYRARLDRVERHALEPPGPEHERRILQLPPRDDVETRLV